jgi:hypothetical protein
MSAAMTRRSTDPWKGSFPIFAMAFKTRAAPSVFGDSVGFECALLAERRSIQWFTTSAGHQSFLRTSLGK